MTTGYFLEKTGPRDPDLEEDGQKEKGERNNESWPPAVERVLTVQCKTHTDPFDFALLKFKLLN